MASGSSIQVLPATGGGLTTVFTAVGGTLTGPAWSPDGARISFIHVSAGTFSIKVIQRSDGSVLSTLVTGQFVMSASKLDWARTQLTPKNLSRH